MVEQLFKLKRASSRRKEMGKAPHKPIMILAVIELLNQGKIRENKIRITPELVATFQSIWLELVPKDTWQARFFLPFYHLTGDKFWSLKTVPGAEVSLTGSYSPKSMTALKDSIEYATFEVSVWTSLSNPSERSEIKRRIQDHYFAKRNYLSETVEKGSKNYLNQLELNFLGSRAAEKPTKYFMEVEYEARSTVFKTEVPKIYQYTCAISRQQITTNTSIQMIDACHIQPWTENKLDTIQNGISLTPTLHRAFDRFLISIDENYQVILSKAFIENRESSFSLTQFEGTKIHLPERKEWWPSQELLEKHRSNLD